MAGIDNLTPFDSERARLAGLKGGAAKKGKKHINTWIQEILEDENFETTILDAKEGVREYKGAPLKAIIKAQAHIALHSRDEATRIKATDLLMKHGWPSKSETDLTSKGDAIDGSMNPATAAAFAEFLKKGK